MKRRIVLALALLASISASAKPLPSGRWSLDPQHSRVQFTVTKLQTTRVHGTFSGFRGEVVYDAADPARSSVWWRVPVATVETGERGRDRSLQGQSYFHAERFPEMSFVSRRVRPLPDGRMVIEGNLTIRGVTRPIVVQARPMSTSPAAPAFETEFEIDRFDFGVEGGEFMRRGISRKVQIHLLAVGRKM